MSDQGKANYEAWRSRLNRVSLNQTANDWDELPSIDRAAFDAGADAVELWLSQAPVDEDAPGNEPDDDAQQQTIDDLHDLVRNMLPTASTSPKRSGAATRSPT